MDHPKKKDDSCVLAMGGPLFLEVKAPSEVVATVANHGRLVRELEVCTEYLYVVYVVRPSGSITFVLSTNGPQRVGTCMSPILVTKRLVTNLLTRSSQRGHLSNYLLPSVSPTCCHLHYHFLACLLSFSRAMDSHLDVAPGVSACDESKTACKYRVYPSLSPQCSTPPLTGSRSNL